MSAAIPCLFSEYAVPLPVSVCCFVSEAPDCRPLREISAVRQGTESLTCFSGAGVAKLPSGEAKSTASPNAAFMIPPDRAGVIGLLPLVKVQFRAELAHTRKQESWFPAFSPASPRRAANSNLFPFQSVDLGGGEPL